MAKVSADDIALGDFGWIYSTNAATSGAVFCDSNPMFAGRGKRMVTVYRVLIVDKENEEVMDEQKVVGESEADAMLNIELTPEMRKLKKQDKLAIVTESIGQFEKFEVQEVRIRGTEIDD